MTELPEFADGAALVIGGSGGIGAAICTTLASLGSDVALTYRTRQGPAEEIAGQVRALGRKAEIAQVDVEDQPALRAVVDGFVAKFGRLHSVVHAAGPPLEFQYIADIPPSEWARVMASDVNGAFNVISATLGHMRTTGGAYVALVTGAVDRAPPRDIMSAAPKAAIQMLMRGVAREEGRHGIRANCVGPGYIEAGLGLSAVQHHTRDYVDRMVRAIPLKRAGRPEDVADVVAFLLSDRARYVTGATIPVAGGLQLA